MTARARSNKKVHLLFVYSQVKVGGYTFRPAKWSGVSEVRKASSLHYVPCF
jgi:hypothetical protein